MLELKIRKLSLMPECRRKSPLHLPGNPYLCREQQLPMRCRCGQLAEKGAVLCRDNRHFGKGVSA